ncbi:site-specific integrase [Bradyrhizobium sp. UFLA01-814]|uniref:tyrosine-type recombinase/integrase n=1 Tax=Bradyrhizobium sp. UFLA01-814 TaxID=3023480 RepID=UPI00398AEBED
MKYAKHKHTKKDLPMGAVPSPVVSTEGSAPGPRNIAASLLALGRGATKGPEKSDDILVLRKSRSTTGTTDGIFYLEGASTGLRESEGELAETLKVATRMATDAERLARVHPESIPLEAIIRNAIGIEPPEILGKREHDLWKVKFRRGNILLKNLEEGLTVGTFTEAKLAESWDVFAKVPVAYANKTSGGEGDVEVKVKKGAKKPRTLSYTYIRDTFSWLRAEIGKYLHERHIYWVPPLPLPTTKVRREEFLCRDDLARLLWACRGRIWLNALGGWIKVRKIVDGVDRLVNYIDHELARQAKGIARALLLMVYTGLRKSACKKILWNAHATQGHIDVVDGIIRRVGYKQLTTNKTQRPTSHMLDRILQHCRRWHAADTKNRYDQVVRNKENAPYTSSFDAIFDSVVDAAGLSKQIVVHTMRHTCATWQAIVGVPIQAAADLIGVTVDTLEDVYRKWHPSTQEVAAKAWRDRENLARLKRVKFADLPDRADPDARVPSRALPREGRERKTRDKLRSLAAANAGVLS